MSGPITSQCSPSALVEASGYAVRAWLPPVYAGGRPMSILDEVVDSKDDAIRMFQETLREDGIHLHAVGWGEIYPEDKHGDRHVEYETYLSGDEVRKAMEIAS
jgi:hypothetical protein